jgi:hypothetical protein
VNEHRGLGLVTDREARANQGPEDDHRPAKQTGELARGDPTVQDHAEANHVEDDRQDPEEHTGDDRIDVGAAIVTAR